LTPYFLPGDLLWVAQRYLTRPPGGTGYVNQIREANANEKQCAFARMTGLQVAHEEAVLWLAGDFRTKPS
jgi:hypothetical protein